MSSDFYQKITFTQKSFRNTFGVSKGLNPDQDRCSDGQDLSPNCLQRLSADNQNGMQARKEFISFCSYQPTLI